MNTKALIDVVANELGCKKNEAARFVDAVIDGIVTGIVNEGVVSLPGLGKFEVKEVAEREGRNPQTGESLVIAAHSTLKFRAAGPLKETIR